MNGCELEIPQKVVNVKVLRNIHRFEKDTACIKGKSTKAREHFALHPLSFENEVKNINIYIVRERRHFWGHFIFRTPELA